MKAFFIFIVYLISLSSCHVELWVDLEVSFSEPHPYEEASGKELWYELRYFNGREIIERILPSGTNRFTIRVLAGGMRPVAVIPLGFLSPYGGFYEPGMKKVELCSASGALADLLVDTSAYNPDAVSMLSIGWLEDCFFDLSVISESSLLENLYNGTLSNNSLKTNKIYHIEIDMLPSGYWISDRVEVKSFVLDKSGDVAMLSLFPGYYCFWNRARSLLFSVIITEDGRYYTQMRSLNSPF